MGATTMGRRRISHKVAGAVTCPAGVAALLFPASSSQHQDGQSIHKSSSQRFKSLKKVKVFPTLSLPLRAQQHIIHSLPILSPFPCCFCLCPQMTQWWGASEQFLPCFSLTVMEPGSTRDTGGCGQVHIPVPALGLAGNTLGDRAESRKLSACAGVPD